MLAGHSPRALWPPHMTAHGLVSGTASSRQQSNLQGFRESDSENVTVSLASTINQTGQFYIRVPCSFSTCSLCDLAHAQN